MEEEIMFPHKRLTEIPLDPNFFTEKVKAWDGHGLSPLVPWGVIWWPVFQWATTGHRNSTRKRKNDLIPIAYLAYQATSQTPSMRNKYTYLKITTISRFFIHSATINETPVNLLCQMLLKNMHRLSQQWLMVMYIYCSS